MTNNWEYMVKDLNRHVEVGYTTEELNQMGTEGWELVEICYSAVVDGGPKVYRAFFKRPATQVLQQSTQFTRSKYA